MKAFFKVFFSIDARELEKVPTNGPLILMANHTSNLEGPMLNVYLQPRHIIALAKQELWESRFMASLMNMWGCIPVDRQNMSRSTMDACLKVLDEQGILAIAPEGTRSKDGNLQEGKAGVAFIAHKKDAPMLPVVVTGFDQFPRNIKRLKRTKVAIKVGPLFEVAKKGGRLDAEGRQALADEIMLRLAMLMEEDRRGFYRDRPFEFTLTKNVGF